MIAGSYTGDCLIYNNDSGSIYQDVLTTDDNGITNYIKICKPSSKVYFASNDCHLREFHLDSARIVSHKFPFAINCLAVCPTNPSLQLLVGDCSDSYIMDSRVSVTRPINKFQTHYDYSFCCDWSGYCDSLIATGNQDGTAVVHDLRRPQLEFQCFASYQGHLNDNNNSIRNLKFSKQRNFLCFSETIDNVNIVNLHDNSGQNIGTFGKVSGLSLTSSDNDNGEILTVGISDNSVGGILQYGFDSPGKCLDFDFY